VALEILSGKNNNNYMPSDKCVCLLDRVLYNSSSGLIRYTSIVNAYAYLLL